MASPSCRIGPSFTVTTHQSGWSTPGAGVPQGPSESQRLVDEAATVEPVALVEQVAVGAKGEMQRSLTVADVVEMAATEAVGGGAVMAAMADVVRQS